jgi:hypothetical protein
MPANGGIPGTDIDCYTVEKRFPGDELAVIPAYPGMTEGPID